MGSNFFSDYDETSKDAFKAREQLLGHSGWSLAQTLAMKQARDIARSRISTYKNTAAIGTPSTRNLESDVNRASNIEPTQASTIKALNQSAVDSKEKLAADSKAQEAQRRALVGNLTQAVGQGITDYAKLKPTIDKEKEDKQAKRFGFENKQDALDTLNTL